MSIIIPVYNEGRYLAACLDSIAAQTEAPYEVIVVDNNSTDDSAMIARRYPFVTLIRERQQGLVPARNTGLARARGDILARINGNIRLAPDWVAELRATYAANPRLGGVSGVSVSFTFFFAPDTVYWSLMYYWWTGAYFRLPVMWGTNMSLRREVWQKIKAQACPNNTEVHEDQDLSLLVSAAGWQVRHNRRLRIYIHGLEYNNWPQFAEYMHRRWLTKRRHEQLGTYQAAAAQVTPRWRAVLTYALLALPGWPFIAGSFVLGLPGMVRKALKRPAA